LYSVNICFNTNFLSNTEKIKKRKINQTFTVGEEFASQEI